MSTRDRSTPPRRPRRQKIPGRGRRWFAATGWRHVVGIFMLFFALFPVYFVIIASFSDSGTLSGQQLVPESLTTKQYDRLFDDYPYWNWFFNSLIVSVVVAFGTVFLASLAAYAFSRLRFKGRRPGVLALLLIQMFPASLAFVAVYLMVDQLSDTYPRIGSGTIVAIMLFYLGGALGANAWLIKGFFDTVPRDLDESAQIDGATHNQTFFRIILPLAAPVLAIIFLLSFIPRRASSSSPRSSCSARTSPRPTSPPPSACAGCSPATATTCAGDRSPPAAASSPSRS